MKRAYWAGALARGDRVITPSNFAAASVAARYQLTPDRITVIPRQIDIAAFDPARVDRARVDAFFAEATAFAEFWRRGEGSADVMPLGERTPDAWAALAAIRTASSTGRRPDESRSVRSVVPAR